MKQTEGDGGRKVRSVDGSAGKASAGAGGGREREEAGKDERALSSLTRSLDGAMATHERARGQRQDRGLGGRARRSQRGRERERIRKGAEFFRQPSSARSFQHMRATKDQMERERGMLYDEISRSGLSI